MRSSLPFGIIADDLTGCGDVAYFCAQAGLRTLIAVSGERIKVRGGATPSTVPPDVLILNTESRHDRPRAAYRKVRAATRMLSRWGARWIYKKIDSTLRGNIGAELTALVEGLRLTALPLVSAFPRMGRTTNHGFQCVNGQRLDHTPFAHDLRSPVTEAHIPTLLHRTCAVWPRILVYDCASQVALEQLARHLVATMFEPLRVSRAPGVSSQHDLPVIAGAAGLLEELLPLLVSPPLPQGEREQDERRGSQQPARSIAAPNIPSILVISGSQHPATQAQLRQLTNSRRPGVHLLKAPNHRGSPASVLRALIQRAVTCIQRFKPQALILIGGDTASHVCRGLGVKYLAIESPVSPGVVLCRALDWEGGQTPRGLTPTVPLLLLKPGGFGEPDLLLRCVRWLATPHT